MNKIKKLVLLFIVSVLLVPQVKADEGMWLLPLIEKLNIKDMKKAGFKLSAKDIYSINQASIKDAIVIFGGGCTGEIISNQGLLLTNHHCGYSAIQQHSSVEHNYLKDGFWAKNKAEELHTPGLKVQFLDRIEDITAQILPALENVKSEEERNKIISKLADSINKKAVNNVSYLRSLVVPMFGGNDFYLVVYKVYDDVRMVGAPPSSVGKFGADTDNWMWPRHTADFSLFRVYADKDGNPAPYSADNVPLKPKYHIPISLKGVAENDFAMVIGFPGSTQRYMTSWEIAERISISNANRIKIRGIRQELMMEDMLADPKVKIQYATKYSGSSNYWKNSIGMNEALTKLKVIDQKRAQETQFTNWIGNNTDRKAKYGNALPYIQSAVQSRGEILNASQYMSETLTRGSEVIGWASNFVSLYKLMTSKEPKDSLIQKRAEALKKGVDDFFKDYNEPTDKKISAVMFKLYADDVPVKNQISFFEKIKTEYNGDYAKFTDSLFNETFFLNKDKVNAFLDKPTKEALEGDLAFQMALSITEMAEGFQKINIESLDKYRKGHREYVAGLREMYNGVKPLYPDANFTMRMTYGKVAGYEPADAKYFDYVTTLKGVMQKEDPANWEFEVPEKLKQLYQTKDFGPYAMKDGRMPVNFIFDGDITGGNSGSPVLNAKGELIGTAFDGNWEAMSGDIAFENELQRCINVDIRYTLFIIDKFAGAGYLLNEMTIVK